MRNTVLYVLLICILSIAWFASAKNVNAIDSDGRVFNGSGVVSPGKSITFTCPHSENLKWSRLRGQITEKLEQNSNINIIQNKLKINNVNFQDTGLYYCEQDAVAYRFFLHVLEITKVVNGTVSVTTFSNEINGVTFNQSKINEKVSTNISCLCNDGTNTTHIIINWKGGLYDKLSDLYTIFSSRNELGMHSNLVLKKSTSDKAIYGEYTCSCNVVSGTSIERKVYMEVPPTFEDHKPSMRTTEGENITINCNVWGYPAILNSTVYWSFQNQRTFRNGITVLVNSSYPGLSKLIIPKVSNADRGVYTCHASNRVGMNSASTMLRVKGQYAALWPFIGIVIQLVILIIIIVAYEYKKKSQKSKEDPICNYDSKNEVDATGSDRGNESVRQRLVKM